MTTLTTPRRPEGRNGSGATPAGIRFAGRPQRRIPWIALGVIIVLGSGLGFALWATSLGDRMEAVAAATDVEAGQVIAAADLRVVRVGVDQGVQLVSADELGSIVGRVAATSIARGGLLRPSDIRATSLIARGQAVVGVALKGGAVPVAGLRVGDTVEVVAIGGQTGSGDSAGEVLAEATVFEVHAADPSTGSVVVSLLVPRTRAVAIANAAGGDRVRLVLLDQALGGS